MKKSIFSLLAALVFVPMFTYAATPVKKYNAYWVATSGEEKIIVAKISTTEEALIRNANGQPEYMNMEVLDKAFNFSFQTEIQGRQITAHQYVVVDETAETEMNNTELAVWAPVCSNAISCATLACHGIEALPWIAVGGKSCAGPNPSKVCMAWKSGYPAIVGQTFFYISCK